MNQSVHTNARRMLTALSLAASLLAAAPVAAQPRPALADVPVASAQTVAPASLRTAAALAARGASPVEVALKAAGPFEGVTQQIVQVNEGVEGPSASRVTIVRDGLLDDSLRGVRWDMRLERTQAGGWRIAEAQRAWRCRRGAETERFIAGPCP